MEQPFNIKVSQNTLDSLAQKLAIATLPAPAPVTYTDNEDWTYGVPRPTLERLLIHWRTSFLPRWQEHQEVLNALPQFTRSIEVDGHGVFTAHYVHKQSTHNPKGAIPLLFLHGCTHIVLYSTQKLSIVQGLVTSTKCPSSFLSSPPRLPTPATHLSTSSRQVYRALVFLPHLQRRALRWHNTPR